MTRGGVLAGRTVVVTRPAERATRLVNQLDQRGARVLVAPAIQLRPVRSAALTARAPRPRGRDVRVDRPDVAGDRADVRRADRGAARGPRTGRRRRRGHRGRVRAVGAAGTRARPRVLHRRVAGARVPARERSCAVRPRGHRARRSRGRARGQGVGADKGRCLPDHVPAIAARRGARALAAGEVDAITFTSASTVRGFIGALGAPSGDPKVVCIGPVTAREAREHGLTVHAVAKPHTTDGLVEALERASRRNERGRAAAQTQTSRAPGRCCRPRASPICSSVVPVRDQPAHHVGELARVLVAGHVVDLDKSGSSPVLNWPRTDDAAPRGRRRTCRARTPRGRCPSGRCSTPRAP